MNRAKVVKSVRNLRNVVAININRVRGREFIPKVRDSLSIETSSLCNLECRFCAYVKKSSPKITMKEEFFENCVTQAVALGYREIDLTPCTGDVFMDRGAFDKLEFLDAHPAIRAYAFHTNFTIPDRDDVGRLFRLEKLSRLIISIYGHDEASFKAVTLSTDKVYQRLVANLEALLRRLEQRKFDLMISVHPGRRSLAGIKSDISRLMAMFAKAGIPVKMQKGLYNNWGGIITKDDVRDLPFEVVGPNAIYKSGACVRLLTGVQIMATGIVNGCNCRDANATLRLGDLNEMPLRQILSNRNAAYMSLIDEQQRGEFRPVCQSCDMYSSIHHKNSGYRKNGVALESLAEFKVSLG